MAIQQRAEETRARLLQAAADCFARDGYDATGVAGICKAAGVSKGAFYHHFDSKHAVFMALLDEWLEGLEKQMVQLHTPEAFFPEEMQSIAGLAGGIYQAADQRFPLFLEFWSRSARDPEVWEATIAPYYRYRDLFARMIEEGIREGSLQPTDPQIAARVLLSLAMGLLLQGLLDPQGADWEEVAREGIRILLEGAQRK